MVCFKRRAVSNTRLKLAQTWPVFAEGANQKERKYLLRTAGKRLIVPANNFSRAREEDPLLFRTFRSSLFGRVSQSGGLRRGVRITRLDMKRLSRGIKA